METINFNKDVPSTPGDNNQKELTQFLSHFRGCQMQSIDDSPAKNVSLAKIFEYDEGLLKSLQDKGAGIFCGINPTRGGTRDVQGILNISALVLDLDVAKEGDRKGQEEIQALKIEMTEKVLPKIPQKPHFIIETKNGLQPIWLFEPYTTYQTPLEANDKYKAVVKGLCMAIGRHSEGDSVIRVFRCPYTRHQKTPSEPFDVRLMEDNSSLPRYSFDDFLRQYGTHIDKKSGHKLKKGLEEPSLEDNIKAAAKDAGIAVSFIPQANATKTIVEDGEKTSGFISQNGLFCYSMSGKERKGGPIQVVGYYLNYGPDEAKEWLSERFGMKFKFDAFRIARMVQQKHDVAQLSKTYFKYSGGVWEQKQQEQINLDIIKALEHEGVNHKRHKINEVRQYLDDFAYDIHGRNLGKKMLAPTKGRKEIVFSNGIFDLESWELRPFIREDYVITRLPLVFEPRVYSCPKFLKFLDEIFPTEEDRQQKMLFLQEWMGWSLVADTTHEKSLILVGEGSNGKSVLLYAWAKMVGDVNCSAVDLHSLDNPQFVMQLMGKLINISSEIRSGAQLGGHFKKLVSGDEITGKSVYEKPFKFTNYARLVFATNSLPSLQEVGDAIGRRLHILRFNAKFTEATKDRNLKFKLEEELNDIGLWALEGLKRLKDRGHFDPPKSVEEAVGSYLIQNDTVKLFLQSKYEITKNSDDRTPKTELYEKYKDFCRSEGHPTLANRRFYERLHSMGVSDLKSVGIYYLQGIKEIVDRQPS